MTALAIPTPSSAADSEIVVRARGRLGTENVDLMINGAEVASWELDGSWFQNFVYQVPAGTTINQVRVRNNSGGWPSAVIVDWIEVDGRRIDSSDGSVRSQGSWNAATGCSEGYKLSDWLTCDNSWFDYPLGLDGDLLEVVARGRLGTEDVDLMINGAEVASWELDTSFRSYVYRVPSNTRIDQLRLRNDSGGWPSAVVVDYVRFLGLTYDSSSWRTLSSGAWDAASGCAQGVKQSDWLTCDNSWFDYAVDSFYPRYRTVRVNARGRLGTETIGLVVNGRRVETWDLSTDFQTFLYLYSPDQDLDSIRVESDGPGWPNAVIVDYVRANGFEIDSSDGRTRSSGSWNSATGCSVGIKRSDWLTCDNAWFEYDLRSARDPLN